MAQRKYFFTEQQLREAVASSFSFAETARKLQMPLRGNNASTIKRRIGEYKIDISHFTGHAMRYDNTYVPASNYLANGVTIPSQRLLRKLLREGIKENRCEICGIKDWNGKELTFQLHHIDGVPTNNELGNLQVLCPNCHSQTDNFANKKREKKEYFCKQCGRKMKTKCPTQLCIYCNRAKQARTVPRPSQEELLNLIKERGYCGTARIYGVTDNAIRKWVRTYKKYGSDYASIINK